MSISTAAIRRTCTNRSQPRSDAQSPKATRSLETAFHQHGTWPPCWVSTPTQCCAHCEPSAMKACSRWRHAEASKSLAHQPRARCETGSLNSCSSHATTATPAPNWYGWSTTPGSAPGLPSRLLPRQPASRFRSPGEPSTVQPGASGQQTSAGTVRALRAPCPRAKRISPARFGLPVPRRMRVSRVIACVERRSWAAAVCSWTREC